jgi:hypothetical protein
MNRPPNGSNGRAKINAMLKQPMTPEERVLWMAKQQLPPGYTLLHASEVEAIGQGLQAEHRARIALQREIEDAKTHLDNYWTTQPDMSNAIQEAVFDARRHHRSAETALTRLKQTEALLLLMMTKPELGAIGPMLMIDIINEHNFVKGTIAFIEQQLAARREMTKPT